MDIWVWILIAVVVLVVIGVALWLAQRRREQMLEEKRHEAAELRETASAQSRRADEREALARETAQQAEVDPDTDD
jgi:FtsZ-interacting cell division protein ZipA